MRIPTNQHKSILNFAQKELAELYPPEEIQAIMLWLFEDFLNLKKADVFLNLQKGVSESELLKFNFAIKELKKGKPVQYVLGYTWFDGLKIRVSSDTLIPRPETEELVNIIVKDEKSSQPLEIIDLGTGTGCIPISLSKNMPQHRYTGLDFAPRIIDLANSNAKFHQIPLALFTYDLLNPPKKFEGKWDVVVSNPPYVLESDKTMMQSNVVNYEPASALYVPNDNPLLFYKSIMDFTNKHLNNGGRLYLEIHENYGFEVNELLKIHHFTTFDIIKDFRDKDRFIKAIKQN